MTSHEIRSTYLDFFKKRGHAGIPSSSLVPENDPTTLFVGSGMQPLLPYLLGQKHPMGKQLVNSQKCFRAEDIEEVGDNRHTTFFEMLGNWSLGEYFKKEQLPWFFEFLTKELGLDPERLYVTVFSGDKENNIPKDEESVAIWKRLFQEKGIEAKDVELITTQKGGELGMQGGRIFAYDSGKNWWSRSGIPENMPAGEPGGPDSEVFYEFQNVEHNPAFGKNCHPNYDCGRFLEIGNCVFMEYQKKEDGGFEKLAQQNVDFGGGLERIAAALLDSPDVFKGDLLFPVIEKIQELCQKQYKDTETSFRVIADHIRGAVFMMADGVRPSNTERGYVVRRLVRRSVRHANILGMKEGDLSLLAEPIIQVYSTVYPELKEYQRTIFQDLQQEEVRFRQTLAKGLREFEKLTKDVSGKEAFDLYQTYGFPLDVTLELAKEKGFSVDVQEFNKEFQKHQEVSRTAAAGRFKGGLADTSYETTKLHTANHLLLAALRQVLGDHVHQRGSNITVERIRLDFSYPQKLAPEQLQQVEDLVNQKIQEGLDMVREEMPKEEAMKLGAEMEFGVKYGDVVSVYFAKDTEGNVFSKEFCGGPHVENTKELGTFKIIKEESISAGVRRVRAVLET
tara:strand:+ start:3221 stop:5083 length:1863 start_codon:yes stop_codon:yes gene_type:complete